MGWLEICAKPRCYALMCRNFEDTREEVIKLPGRYGVTYCRLIDGDDGDDGDDRDEDFKDVQS